LIYEQITNKEDPAFGPKWRQSIVDAFMEPYDAHGGSILACLAHLVFPSGTAIALYLTASGRYAMDTSVKVQAVLKRTLRLHAAVFLFYSLGFEFAPFVLCKLVGVDFLPSTASIFVIKTALADMFFVGAVLCVLMSLQETLPRWATWVPFIQASYNVMNDYRWSFDTSVPGGIAVPYRLRYLDGAIFLSLFTTYTYAHFNAVVVTSSNSAIGEKKWS